MALQATPLLPGEQVLVRLLSNHVSGGRAFDGYLYVTSKRLVFMPWQAAVARGSVPFTMSLSDVSGADVAPRGTNWRDGSWRRRLRVATSSGASELFVVWRPQRAVEIIEQARQDYLNPA